MGYLPDNFTCDACAKQRVKDTNHWWMVTVKCAPASNGTRSLTVSPWTLEMARKRDVLHACGEECVPLLIQRWLATGDFRAPSQRVMLRARADIALDIANLNPAKSSGENLIPFGRRTGSD